MLEGIISVINGDEESQPSPGITKILEEKRRSDLLAGSEKKRRMVASNSNHALFVSEEHKNADRRNIESCDVREQLCHKYFKETEMKTKSAS